MITENMPSRVRTLGRTAWLAFVRGETILGAQISEHPQCMR
jgi:hypothetical protein